MPAKQKPDRTVAGSSKRHASRFYQLKPGHCLIGQYLNWTKSRPSAQCWCCPCGRRTGVEDGYFAFFYPFSLVHTLAIFLGQAWAEGKGKLATNRQRADSRGETVKIYAAVV
jgi:hypothetical protein